MSDGDIFDRIANGSVEDCKAYFDEMDDPYVGPRTSGVRTNRQNLVSARQAAENHLNTFGAGITLGSHPPVIGHAMTRNFDTNHIHPSPMLGLGDMFNQSVSRFDRPHQGHVRKSTVLHGLHGVDPVSNIGAPSPFVTSDRHRNAVMGLGNPHVAFNSQHMVNHLGGITPIPDQHISMNLDSFGRHLSGGRGRRL